MKTTLALLISLFSMQAMAEEYQCTVYGYSGSRFRGIITSTAPSLQAACVSALESCRSSGLYTECRVSYGH